MPLKEYPILGLPITALTRREAIDLIITAARQPGSPARYVVKPYVEFLDRSVRDPATLRLLQQAWLRLPDGVSLSWAAYYLYGSHHNLLRWFATLTQIVLQPAAVRRILPETFAGISFTWPLLAAAAQAKLKVFLIGSPINGAIEHTAATIAGRLPDIQLVGTHTGRSPGTHSGTVDDAWRESVRRSLLTTKPDLILVGLGFPLQEAVMAELTQALPHGIFIGEGGTFDYQSFGGQRRRAPAWIQRLGLEWLWRLVLEPKRLGRQMAVLRFMGQIYQAGRRLDAQSKAVTG